MFDEQQLSYDGLHELAEAIRYFADRAYPDQLKKYRPKPITNLRPVREEFEMSQQFEVYAYDLPTDKPPVEDLTKLVVETKIGDAQAVVDTITLEADQSVPADKIHREVRGLQDATGSVSLYWLDDGGNKTGVGTNQIVFADKLTTEASPGPLQNVTHVREEFEPDAPTT